eukprot:2547509-Prymnesium_polylepis.1
MPNWRREVEGAWSLVHLTQRGPTGDVSLIAFGRGTEKEGRLRKHGWIAINRGNTTLCERRAPRAAPAPAHGASSAALLPCRTLLVARAAPHAAAAPLAARGTCRAARCCRARNAHAHTLLRVLPLSRARALARSLRRACDAHRAHQAALRPLLARRRQRQVRDGPAGRHVRAARLDAAHVQDRRVRRGRRRPSPRAGRLARPRDHRRTAAHGRRHPPHGRDHGAQAEGRAVGRAAAARPAGGPARRRPRRLLSDVAAHAPRVPRLRRHLRDRAQLPRPRRLRPAGARVPHGVPRARRAAARHQGRRRRVSACRAPRTGTRKHSSYAPSPTR